MTTLSLKNFCPVCGTFSKTANAHRAHMETARHHKNNDEAAQLSNRRAFISFAICMKRRSVMDDITYAVGLWMRTDIYRHTITAPIHLNILAFTVAAMRPLKVVLLNTKSPAGNSVLVVDSTYSPAEMKLRLLEYYQRRMTAEDWTQMRALLVSTHI